MGRQKGKLMYTITNLELANICQYDRYEVIIPQGLMAVCGKNGSGKTTLLRALMYGLTGLVDGSWGTQQSLQKDGSTSPGHVDVTFKDFSSGVAYSVRRYSATGVKFPDSLAERKQDQEWVFVAKGRKIVNEKLTELFGITPALLFQLAWGRQGRLDQLLTAPAAYVTTFLSSVFDMKHIEQLRDKLKNEIDTIAVMSDPMPEINRLAAEREGLKEQLAGYELQLPAAQKTFDDLDKRVSELHTSIKADVIANTREVEQLKHEERRLDAEVRHEYELLHSELVSGTFAELDEKCTAVDEEERRAFDDLHDAESALSGLEAKMSSDRLTAQSTRMQLKALEDKTAMREKLSLIDDCCPLCGSAVPKQAQFIYDSKVDGLCEYDREEERRLKETLAANEADLEQLGPIWWSRKQFKEDLSVKINEIQSRKSALYKSRNYARYKEALTANRNRQKQLSEAGYDTEALDALKTAEREKGLAESALSVLKANMQDAQSRITVIDGLIDRLEAEKEQHEINRESRYLLTTLRDAFSQQRAQARFFASKIERLNAQLEEFMTFTEMPFSLRLNPDTRTFEYTSSDGFVHPACHLSGAQRNISSVALQMALVAVVQQNINLFLFDEPSEALDVENKYVMAEMFKRMNRMLPSIGGTMLIVSRDEQLIESCENTINITKE